MEPKHSDDLATGQAPLVSSDIPSDRHPQTPEPTLSGSTSVKSETEVIEHESDLSTLTGTGETDTQTVFSTNSRQGHYSQNGIYLTSANSITESLAYLADHNREPPISDGFKIVD
ncbi:hypothetical protein BROUX41_002359 [Berkeleyomyces rouxiae]|uniref:uncharacterized protein n=1 Tax=Berkeleyomyces rouxiae TaxID=2035830 RepID=UPI003B7CDC07